MGYVYMERPHDFLVGYYILDSDGDQEWQNESQYVFSEEYPNRVGPLMSYGEAKAAAAARCHHLNGGGQVVGEFVNASDVVCPTCDSDPGRKCKDMDLPEVHFTRALRADAQRVRKPEEDR